MGKRKHRSLRRKILKLTALAEDTAERLAVIELFLSNPTDLILVADDTDHKDSN